MKRIMIIILVLLIAFLLTSVRFITPTGATDLIDSCPRMAIIGKTVTVRTGSVTDGWVEVSCSGAEVTAVQGDLFTFVMPRQNVEVRARFVSDWFED